MVNISGYNAADHEPTGEFEPLPEGKYHAEIVQSEERPIGENGEKGNKLTFVWKILAGPAEGRLVWQDILHGYNVAGEKGDKTRDIAARQLSAICHAIGKLAPADTEDLHHIPCEISVGYQKKRQPTDPTRNEVKNVKALERSNAGQPARATPTSPTASNPAPAVASGGGWPRR